MLSMDVVDALDCPCHSASNQVALLQFYSDTHGTRWTNGWDVTAAQICDWYGITCDATTSTGVHIHLDNNGLFNNGTTLPTSLAAIQEVAYFSASNNALQGALPDAYSVWGRSLQQFAVANNSLISGTLPIAFRNWTSLLYFNVALNNISGELPGEFSEWGSTLSSFVASRNALEGTLPASWGNWTNLTEFIVDNNNLRGLVPTSYELWTKLGTFDVSENVGLTGALPVHSGSNGGQSQVNPIWPLLKSLRLLGCQFNGTLPIAYAAWSQLQSFEVSHNLLSGSLPPQYSQWGAAIRSVSCTNNFITGSLPLAYGQWVGLQALDITGNMIDGTLPQRDAANTPTAVLWPALSIFTVSQNRLQGTLPVEYRFWRNMSIFRLSANSITGTLPPEYGAWGASMSIFDVSLNALSGTIPTSEYIRWTNLAVLHAGGNGGLSGPLPESNSTLGDDLWPNLTSLQLFRNQFTGTIPSTYRFWGRMTTFHVYNNLLSGSLPAQFGDAWKLQLTTFEGFNNRLTGQLPTTYGAWTKIESVRLDNNLLTGSLPMEYGNWGSTLLTFSFINNSLTGSIPSSYASAGWSQLTEFSVSGNALQGSLPTNNLFWISIQYYRVDRNAFSGSLPPEYGDLWRDSLRTFEAYQNKLSGTLPASYAVWVQVDNIRLDDNQLTGTLPPQFQQWTRLAAFSMSDNAFSGTIPAAYATSWPLLNTFDVSINRLTGTLPEASHVWPFLTFFEVSSNQLSGTLPIVYSNWHSLFAFSVGQNLLSGTLPPQYSAWGTSMLFFYAYNNSFSGSLPSAYAAWLNISSFNVAVNAISGSLPPEYGPGWRTAVSIFTLYNNSLSGSIPPEYAAWTRIAALDLSNNLLTGTLPPLSSPSMMWSKMNAFRVYNNKLSGTLPPSYSYWGTSADTFRIENNGFTGPIPASYSAWTAVTYVRALGCSLSGTLPRELSSWVNLQHFRIDDNRFSGTLPPEYSAWGRVNTFIVARNNFSGTLPIAYGSNWTSIARLHLHVNSFTGSIPTEWSAMTTLLELFLHVNDFSGQLPSAFSKLSLLTFFSVAANPKLSGSLPDAWGTAWSSRANGFTMSMLWLQNTSISGVIPSTWKSSMFSSFTLFSVCGTLLCGPAPSTMGLTFAGCVPPFLMRIDVDGSTVDAYVSMVPFELLTTALATTCGATTATPVASTAAPPSTTDHNNTIDPTQPTLWSVKERATTVSAPIGAAVAAVAGAAPSALGIYRSGGLNRLLGCGSTSDDLSEATDAFTQLALGHLLALLTCAGTAAVAVAFIAACRSEASTKGSGSGMPLAQDAALRLRLPGRLSFAILALSPPSWEYGLALMLTPTRSSSSIGLGASSAVVGLSSLIAISLVVVVPMWFRAVFKHSLALQRNQHVRPTCLVAHLGPLGVWWRRIAALYETTREGEWHQRPHTNISFHNRVRANDGAAAEPFMAMFGDLFEEFTAGRHWYMAVQSTLAVVVGATAALAESGAVTSARGCAAVQIIAGVCSMTSFVALAGLRPHRSASSFALDLITEALGFVSGLLVVLVGAVDDGDDDGLTRAADVMLQIQFWATIALSIPQAVYEAVLWWASRPTKSFADGDDDIDRRKLQVLALASRTNPPGAFRRAGIASATLLRSASSPSDGPRRDNPTGWKARATTVHAKEQLSHLINGICRAQRSSNKEKHRQRIV